MAKDELIELGLAGRLGTPAAAGAPNDPVRVPLEKLLTLLRDFVAAIELADEGTLHESIERCRSLVASTADPTAILAAIDACNVVCRKLLGDMDRQRIEQKEEIATLVDMVREALALVAGDGKTFSKNLGTSMKRFEALVQISNIRQLKVELTREVSTLRQLAEERQKTWETTCQQFGEKVDTLERQLSVSKQEASLDSLTRIANRGTFDRRCSEWLGEHKQFVLGIIDIDHFKTINDAHGHPAGDRALMAVAEALKNLVRQSDVVARLGGDEFAVLASDLSLRQAESRLRMLNTTASEVPLEGAGGRFKLTLSCGVAECSAGDTLESLMERADAALYQAKKLGRNRVVSKEKATLRDLLKRH
jgi:diguanylate cyclase (GGDEF)-like protein